MTSPDLTEFFKLSRPKKKPCAIGFALTQLKPTERDQLVAALATDKGIITGSAVEQWLKARGQTANPSAITAHRIGRCSCND